MKKHILIGNFGNHSLAVMQFLLLQDIQNLHFCYVDTGFASADWLKRVDKVSSFAKAHGVNVHQLKPKANFTDLARSRNQFPSRKFQWCASFLKGLPLLEYLEELDPSCEAIIVSGKRQQDAKRFVNLQEFEESEHFEGRTLWHPLYNMGDESFHKLIMQTGFPLLKGPSLECSPCIHLPIDKLALIDKESIERLITLENELQKTMYEKPVEILIKESSPTLNSKADLQHFDLGCGAIFACGE